MARASIVISTYNRRHTLKRAINSVLNQSVGDFEILVIDDCSTDDTEKLVKSIGDPRIRYFKTDKNSGHDGLPKNIAIKNAVGDYVAFLDDDDEYRVDALKILLTYAIETDTDVVYGDYLINGKPGWSVEFSAARLTEQNFISMSVTMVKRDWLCKVGGFDEEVPKFKDWNLWLRLHKAGARFIHIPIIVTEVHTHENSVSNKFRVDYTPDGRMLPTYFKPADCKIWPDKTSLGQRKPLKVAVYTLAMNRLEYTKRMHKALEKTAHYSFDWFVIDQGSTDGTAEWIKSLTRDNRKIAAAEEGTYCVSNIKYRIYQKNVGLAKGWNNIVQWIKDEGGYDIVIKVDNDAEMMTDGWLAAMVDVFERNRRLCLSPYVEGLDGSPGGVLRQRASGDSPYMMINDHVLGLVPHLGGIVYASPIELWKEFIFDDAYEGNKDYLFSQHVMRNGYFMFYMEEFRVWHIDGTKGQQEKFPDYFGTKQKTVTGADV